MKKKRILFLAETIDKDLSSAAKANLGLIETLVSQNFEVRVFHYSHTEVLIPNVKVTLVREKKTDINYFLSRGQRVLQRITGKNFSKALENKFGFSFTFKNDAFSMAQAIKKECKTSDLIITRGKGASFRTHAALLQLPDFYNKWLAYVHDPYPFHLYPPPYNWTEAGHQQKEAFFKKVSEKAAFSGFPSQLLKEWMGQFFPNFVQTGIVLPHQDISEKQSNIETVAYFDTKKFNLVHAGNLFNVRNPFPLIEGYLEFLKNYPEANEKSQLSFLGSSHDHQPLLSEKYSDDPTIYISEGYVAFSEVQFVQQNTAVNVIIEADSKISPFLPGKFPYCVKANTPILLLSPRNSESNRLLGDDYEYSSLPTDVNAISKIITSLYLKWKNQNGTLLLDRKDLQTYFSSNFFAQQILEIENSL